MAYNLCIIKPNKSSFSETFVQEHINRLAGTKKVLYGGAFPLYDHNHQLLIKSKVDVLSYLIQKKIFQRSNIGVRTRALVEYFQKYHIDSVFAEYGMVGAMVTEACKLAQVPLVIHFHGAEVYHKETVNRYLNLYKDAFNYASALIVVSKDMVETLENLGADPHKVYNASCGVDTTLFLPVDVSKSPRNFLFVGRFVEKKSPSSVVKAFRLVVDSFNDSKLYMAGDGPLFSDTRQLIASLNLQDHIELTGVLKPEQIRKLMQNMRGFVQHSVTAGSGDKEGTPVSVLEASSSALPVVATRHGGINEAVVHGVTGFLSDEFDIVEMAANMITIAETSEQAAKMGLNGRQHMISKYDIKDRIVLLDSLIVNSIQAS